jgi:hypothetical protein
VDKNRAHFWVGKLMRRTAQLASSYLYVNPARDLDRSILVAGTGRSGTTWLGDLITSQISCRVMFEPFNPDLVSEYSGYNYFQYMRPADEDQVLHEFARKVLSGEIRNRWVDHKNEQIFPEYRIIKEIRANLLLKWLHDRFPEVPILFIMRHPCAVVLSRMELGWATDADIEPFLSQPDLVTDHLASHLELIRNARTDVEKHAIIWCVSNLIPLKQFEPGSLKIVYYEKLCTQPEIELSTILDLIGKERRQLLSEKFDRPSQTTRETSAVVTGADKISSWKRKLDASQIERILDIVNAFGLGELYGDSFQPQDSNIQPAAPRDT